MAIDHIGPTFVNASMAILLAGTLFESREERAACFRVLDRCRELGWPMEGVREQLKESWGLG